MRAGGGIELLIGLEGAGMEVKSTPKWSDCYTSTTIYHARRHTVMTRHVHITITARTRDQHLYVTLMPDLCRRGKTQGQ